VGGGRSTVLVDADCHIYVTKSLAPCLERKSNQQSEFESFKAVHLAAILIRISF
jgi:hypothetical protein